MMQSAGIVVNDVTVTGVTGTQHCAMHPSQYRADLIAALVGVNGSGKSTLFKAIMGFVRDQREDICSGYSPRQALQKNPVAYVPQSEEVDWSFPVLVEDVVMMGRYGHMGMLRIAKRGIVRLSPMRWNVSIWWIFAIDKSASFPVDKRNASFWRERLHSRVM